MSVILGLNIGHPDSSACLFIDGKLVGACAEERFGNRIKHSVDFPHYTIKWLLDKGNINFNEITHVAISKNPYSNLFKKFYNYLSYRNHSANKLKSYINRSISNFNLKKLFSSHFNVDRNDLNFQSCFVEHHIAHISSSYFASNFDNNTLSISFDGSGDTVSMLIAECNGLTIKLLLKQYIPNSLGHFYSMICQFIGFHNFGDEYKVMGLSSYGENEYLDEMKKIIKIENESRYFFDQKYVNHKNLVDPIYIENNQLKIKTLYSNDLIKLLGKPRSFNSEITSREMNIAKSAQTQFENIFDSILKKFLTKDMNITLSGGCALNGVNNSKILINHKINDFYIQSAASDDGTALGAALYCLHKVVNYKKRFHMEHSYWGPSYSTSVIKKSIIDKSLKYIDLNNEFELYEDASNEISKGKIVGWYQDASEWGPRSLGNRAILANPNIKNIKNLINSKIKKRESFRPFAPSVLEEDAHIYFEQSIKSPFMMHVVKFKNKWRKSFPAVTHVDHTARIQTVSKENNYKFYNLIKYIKIKTGHGIVLNTSFNENEPIVNDPSEAISCFLRTNMDILYLHNFKLTKISNE